MAEFTTRDGTQIFYKDWGVGQPIVFSHGWPLSSDDWDAQMLFFLHHGYRVIAHDRRGHGRSAQPSEGNDMDHYADDLADLTAHLDLHDAVHVGHSAGGGEVARYIGRHGESRVAKAVLISAVTPSVLQTETNPVGVPQAAFEGLQAQLAANRSEFYRAVPSGPFYNFDQPGVEPSEAVIANWWRQGMMGGAKGQYDCVSEFIREDWSDDLKKITVPVLAMNGDADQIVPHDTSGPRAVKLVQNGTLKTYAGFPHGMPTTHADTINADHGGGCPTVAICAIDGMAGIGKTTLAIRWANHIAKHFADGQLFINLRGFDSSGSAAAPLDALQALLYSLGVSASYMPDGLDARAGLYRSVLAGSRSSSSSTTRAM